MSVSLRVQVRRVFAAGAVCLLVATGAANAAPGQPDAAPALTPAAWADVALTRCRAEAEHWRAEDAALATRLSAGTPPREQASFLDREHAARALARRNALRGGLARLGTLTFGIDPKVSVDGAAPEPLRKVHEGLLAGLDICELEAVEATIVLGLFDVPFEAALAERLTAEGQFDAVDARIRERLTAGDSLEQIYVALRPASEAAFLRYLDAVVVAALAGHVAEGQPRDPREAGRRRAFLEYLPYAAEPIRLQIYLHGKVDALEGALGVALPDGVDQMLFAMVRGRFHNSLPRLRRLRAQAPDAVARALTPTIDEWFRRVALPSLGRALRRDPHAAYWFFVQSGGVVQSGTSSTPSAVTVPAPAFVLKDLRGLGLDAAIARIGAARLPAAFQQAHARVDAAFTNVTLSRADLAARLERRRVPPALAARLRALMAHERKQTLTSLDVFTLLIRDAHLVRGRLDDEVVRTGIDIFFEAKSGLVDAAVQQVLRETPAADPRLADYLRTTAAMMLERERRQATHGAFREGTGGGAVGWLRGRTVSRSVPVSLPAPGGVTGPAFADLVDALTPKNSDSGNDYRGRAVSGLDLVHDGREYHAALLEVIDTSRHFLNISSFDWKTDAGGRDIAYRLMAKKLGIDGAAYARFFATFAGGLPLDPAASEVVAFYDIPATRMKHLLVWHAFMTSAHPDVVAARDAARDAGASLVCTTVATCGDLSALAAFTAPRDEAGAAPPERLRAWQAYRHIAALFAEGPLSAGGTPTHASLAGYSENAAAVRRFVRRVGLRRADRPGEPFPISIVADGKQPFFNMSWGQRSEQFPYVLTEPVRDVYFLLLEFDVHVVLWKGPVEFPWHAGAVPWPGRKVLGRVPFPFVPWPWLSAVPGFGWANAATSLGLQWVLASDLRIWWASVNHTKSWSSESLALESGMGMGSKYFNEYETHKTWHDMGVLARGDLVDDVNDHFVDVFNQARVNNTGLPAARGVRVPKLRYTDYEPGPHTDVRGDTSRAWLLTTYPERGDANYRGVYLAAIAAARHNIYIENSFFSDPLLARMLMHKAREFRARVSCEGLDDPTCARRRRDAVQIHIVLPDLTDKPIVDAVGASDFHEMLHLGIKVHRWNPRQGWSAARMLHSKVWLIDYEPGRGGLAYVGAANATQRSHLADNEAGILSNDPAFAAQVHDRIFAPDTTVASRQESVENLYVVRSSNAAVRASRWLRRLLVELLWMV